MASFDLLTQPEKEIVMGIVADYHYRTRVTHDDGSLGEINITPKEFNNVLAKVILDSKSRYNTVGGLSEN